MIRCGADREGEGEITGIRAEQRDGENLAKHEAEHGGEHSEHERVEQQHLDDHPARVAVEPQIVDQAPALRNGEQQRIECEQEADERAQRREQAGRLINRSGGALEQSRRDVG